MKYSLIIKESEHAVCSYFLNEIQKNITKNQVVTIIGRIISQEYLHGFNQIIHGDWFFGTIKHSDE